MADDTGWIRFELSEGKSNKFWEIRQEGSDYVVRYGRIGTRGREQRKSFDSEASCMEGIQKKIAEKKRKGYTSQGPEPSELWKAVERGKKAAVRELLAAGACPNESHDGMSLLEYSFECRNSEISLALLDAGADAARLSSQALNLVWAVNTERADVVRAFLDAGAKADVKAMMGSPISVAARRGLVEILEMLIAAGADLDAGGFMDTPLFSAVEQRHAECALRLLEAGASVDPALSANRSVAAWAAKAGMAEVLRRCVRAGADLEHRASFQEVDEVGLRAKVGEVVDAVFDGVTSGEGGVVSMTLMDHVNLTYDQVTPLMVTAGEGHEACVEILIEAGVDLDALDDDGRCAVDHARLRGRTAIVERLVAAGASPEARQPAELRLLLAAESGDLEALRASLADGVEVDAPDRRESQRGRTALMLAAAEGHEVLVAALLEAGADTTRSDDAGEKKARQTFALMMRNDARGRTALHLAAAAGHAGVVRLLMAAGADPAHQDAEKNTALSLAALRDHADAARELIRGGADPNQRGAERATPLHASLENGGYAAAPVLIEAGAKLNLKDGEGETALHIAALMGQADVVQRLLEAGADPTIRNREGELPRGMTDSKRITELLEGAERAWTQSGRAPAPPEEDPEEARARAARARTPEVSAPSVKELEKLYDPEAVLSRLQAAAESDGFRAVLSEIAEACGSEPEDQRPSLGGYLFHVKTGRLDLEGLADLQARLLPRGAFVSCCGDGAPHGTPGSLLVLPTEDRYDALAVLGTNGCNEDVTTCDIIRWLMQREQNQPFSLLWIENDTLKGRFHDPIADPEELAQSMYDLCSDIVEQGCQSVEALAEELAEGRWLFFWWD
jgi:ankyrin repeat protein